MQFNLKSTFLITLLISGSMIDLAAQTGFDADRAFEDLQKQCDLGPRNPGSEGAPAALQYYQSILEPLADSFHLQQFQLNDPYSSEKLNLTNVVARFQPEKTQRIILCAHWDTRPRAEYDPLAPAKPMIGANDGASGVAILLEIARQIHSNPVNPGVDIVLFDGEDYGEPRDLEHYLLGSRYYVEHPFLPMAQQVILLDMVGDAELTLKVDPVSYRSAPRLVEEIWELANDIGYDQFQFVAGASMYDDHVPFIEKGIQAIDIIDFEYPGADNSYWHTHEDTPDKCSTESLEAVGNTVLSWLYQQ